MVVRPSTNPTIVLVTSRAPLLTLASTSSTITLKHPMLKENRMLQAHMLSKTLVRQKIGMHCHNFFRLHSCFTDPPTITPPTPADNQLPKTSSSFSSEQSQSVSRMTTIQMKMLNSLPYEIPSNILHIIATNDSRTHDADKGRPGWPAVFLYS